MTGAITAVPASDAPWADLAAVIGSAATPARCHCQRYKLARGEAFARFPAEERAHRLRVQSACGEPGAPTTGLVGYRDGEPVGWCAVQPRTEYPGLIRNHNRVPWQGRDEDRTDAGVWAVTCFVTRVGHRRQGVATALAAASVGFARERGASAIEGYPMTTTESLLEELHVGTIGMCLAAGFDQLSRPTLRRAICRVDF